MPHQYKKKSQRPITLNEKLYIAAEAMNHSFSLQLVLEMDSEVDVFALSQAIIQANAYNRYAQLLTLRTKPC